MTQEAEPSQLTRPYATFLVVISSAAILGALLDLARRIFASHRVSWLLAGIEVIVLSLALIALWGVVLMALGRLNLKRRNLMQVVATTTLALVAIYGLEWIVADHYFARSSVQQQKTMRLLLAGEPPDGEAGTAAYFKPHPYLDFVLNPLASFVGRKQFLPLSGIGVRRTEPFRPRSVVQWRALALGGSTTFDEAVAREEDTWVYRLEHKIRERYGSNFDVVNGGVGGYNIVESMLSYLLVLDKLDPDLVILYVGINDVHPRLIGELTDDYSNARIPWRGDLQAGSSTVSLAFKWLPFYRLYLLYQVRQNQLGHLYAYVQKPYLPVEQWRDALHFNRTDVYERHLSNLVRLIRARGRQVVVIPQVYVPLPGAADAIYESGVVEINAVNKKVAAIFNVVFASEVQSHDYKYPEHLNDNCHFSVAGSEMFASTVFNMLETKKLIGTQDLR